MEKKINYIGWLGHHNLGDEALYLANKKIFNSYKLVNKHRLFDTTVNLFGGGTVLPFWAYAVEKNKYNYAFGVGVRNPSFWGDFPDWVIKCVKSYNFNNLTVRGYHSQKTLRDWGIDCKVVGDPALTLEPTKYYNYEKSNIVIINAGTSDEKTWEDDNKKIFKNLVEISKYLKSKNYQVIIIPFWRRDVTFCKKLSQESKAMYWNDWEDIQKTLDLISQATILIGEKLHSIVFSAACFVPFISLEYRPKCLDFSNSVGMDDFNIRIDKVNRDSVIDKFNALMKERKNISNLLANNVEYFRNEQRKFKSEITSEIDSIPIDDFASKNKYINFAKEKTAINLIRIFS